MTSSFLFVAALFTLNPVTLTVWPGYAQMRPATFVFVMLTPRHENTREACFEYDGPERRSFCWSIDDARSSRSYRFEWTFRSSGEYTATARVRRIEAGATKTFTDSRPFQVIGMNGGLP